MAGQPIDITTLNPEQLSLLKKDLEEVWTYKAI